MNLHCPEFDLWEELVDYGPTSDGAPYTGTALRVCAIDSDGRRFVHNHLFKVVTVDRDEEGEPHFIVDYKRAFLAGRALQAKIEVTMTGQDAVILKDEYWTETYPVYGSPAWLAEGNELDFREECDLQR